MKRFLHISGFIFTFLAGISFVHNLATPYSLLTKADSVEMVVKAQPEIVSPPTDPRFRLIDSKSFGATAKLKSSDGAAVFADNCVGCERSRDISVFYNTKSTSLSNGFIIEWQCGKNNENLVEKGFKLNENGRRIGIRCLSKSSSGSAHIFWTEGKECWSIIAASVKTAKEFENSETFREWRSQYLLR